MSGPLLAPVYSRINISGKTGFLEARPVTNNRQGIPTVYMIGSNVITQVLIVEEELDLAVAPVYSRINITGKTGFLEARPVISNRQGIPTVYMISSNVVTQVLIAAEEVDLAVSPVY